MCELISTLLVSAAVGISHAATAISGALGTTLFTVGSTSVTVGGALAGAAVVGGIAAGAGMMYKNARANAEAQRKQAEALKKATENTQAQNSKTATGLQDNSRINRTLSSLRVPLAGLNPNNNKDEITKNVYGVDTNNVVSSTMNMTGLNIAV